MTPLQTILLAAQLGQLWLDHEAEVSAKNCGTGAGGFGHGNTCAGQALSMTPGAIRRRQRRGRNAVSRQHQHPKKVHGKEHVDYLKHQHKERVQHALEIRTERRGTRAAHSRERNTEKRQHARQVESLKKKQNREETRLIDRHQREVARAKDPKAAAAQHSEEYYEQQAEHHQAREDQALEHARERRDTRREHRDERKEKLKEHLESVTEFRDSQRAAMAEHLWSIHNERADARSDAPVEHLDSTSSWKPTPESNFKRFEPDDDKAMEAFGGKTSGKWANSLSEADRGAVHGYAGDNYKWMNASLRGAPAEFPEGVTLGSARAHIDAVVKPLKRAKLDRDIVAYRGVLSLDAHGIDPKTLKTGQEIHEKGFSSTTLSFKEANGFAIGEYGGDPHESKAILQFHLPKGTRGAYLNAARLSTHLTEREILMPPGARFRYVKHGGTHKDEYGNETQILVFEGVPG